MLNDSDVTISQNDNQNSSHDYSSLLSGSSFDDVNAVIENFELAKRLMEFFISALRRGDASIRNMQDYIPSVLQTIYNIHDQIGEIGRQIVSKDELFSSFLPSNYISHMNFLQNMPSR